MSLKPATKEEPVFPRALQTLRNFNDLPDAAYVRLPVVEALFCCSSATVWRSVKDGRIPAPYKISDRITGWNVGELRLSLHERLRA